MIFASSDKFLNYMTEKSVGFYHLLLEKNFNKTFFEL
jgi:hypothetical protein